MNDLSSKPELRVPNSSLYCCLTGCRNVMLVAESMPMSDAFALRFNPLNFSFLFFFSFSS